jgi:hypothetical protein
MNILEVIRDGIGLIILGGVIVWITRPRRIENVSVEEHDVLMRDGSILGHAKDCRACARHR